MNDFNHNFTGNHTENNNSHHYIIKYFIIKETSYNKYKTKNF